jgi:hypothetical protein
MTPQPTVPIRCGCRHKDGVPVPARSALQQRPLRDEFRVTTLIHRTSTATTRWALRRVDRQMGRIDGRVGYSRCDGERTGSDQKCLDAPDP